MSPRSLGVEVVWRTWAARKEEEGVERRGSVLRLSLGLGDSVRRTEPGLEVGSLGGSGGGCSAIFMRSLSLTDHLTECQHVIILLMRGVMIR